MEIYKRLDPQPESRQKLCVPRYIVLAQKCVEHKIPDIIIAKSHFNDLYMLIMSIDIANIKHAIKELRKAKSPRRDYTVRDVSGEEAVKFLTGGK